MNRTLLLTLSIACIGASLVAQPITTVRTVTELQSRKALNDETVRVLGYRSAGDWGAPRDFQRYSNDSTATNRGTVFGCPTPGVRYKALDANGPTIDARFFGAYGNGVHDDAAEIQDAADYCAQYWEAGNYSQGGPTLKINPTMGGYLIGGVVKFRTSVDAGGANFRYGGNPNGYAVQVGPDDAEAFAVNGMTYVLPNIGGPYPSGLASGSTGVLVQNVHRSKIHLGQIQWFAVGVEGRGTDIGSALNSFYGGVIENIRIGVRVTTSGSSGWFNGNTFYGLYINNCSASFSPGSETGHEFVNIAGPHNGNAWIGGGWEGFPSRRVVSIVNASGQQFSGIRFEHHQYDLYPDNGFFSLYMEVDGQTPGTGLDNRFTDISMMSGMYGVTVREIGYAGGNSGADVRGTIYRSRDQGFMRGGLTLETSPGADYNGGNLVVYPSMTWPANPASNYTAWVTAMNPTFTRWKKTTDAGGRLHITPNGDLEMFDGSQAFPSLYRWTLRNSGDMRWYDSGGNAVQTLDQYGLHAPTNGYLRSGVDDIAALTWDRSTNAGSRLLVYDNTTAQYLRPMYDTNYHVWYSGSAPNIQSNYLRRTFYVTGGGLQLVDNATNELNGFYTQQRMVGPKAFAGLRGTGVSSNAVDYEAFEFGAGATDYADGWLAGTAGIAVNWTSNSLNRDLTMVVLPNDGKFVVKVGQSLERGLVIDANTTPGNTRASVWVNNSNAPVQLKYDDATGLLFGGPTLSLPGGGGVGTGGVSSVSLATTLSGLTVSGSPVTGIGTLALGGVLGLASGGTGGTNAATALVALGAASTSHVHSGSEITSGTVAAARIDSSMATDAELSAAIAANTNFPSLNIGTLVATNFTVDGTNVAAELASKLSITNAAAVGSFSVGTNIVFTKNAGTNDTLQFAVGGGTTMLMQSNRVAIGRSTFALSTSTFEIGGILQGDSIVRSASTSDSSQGASAALNAYSGGIFSQKNVSAAGYVIRSNAPPTTNAIGPNSAHLNYNTNNLNVTFTDANTNATTPFVLSNNGGFSLGTNAVVFTKNAGTNDTLAFNVGGANTFYAVSNRIGIGKVPGTSYAVEVQGAVNVSGAVISSSYVYAQSANDGSDPVASLSSSAGGMRVAKNASSVGYTVRSNAPPTTNAIGPNSAHWSFSTNKVRLWTTDANTNATEQMTIDTSGELGINSIVVGTNDTTSPVIAWWGTNTVAGNKQGGYLQSVQYSTTDNNIVLGAVNSGSNSPNIRLQIDGWNTTNNVDNHIGLNLGGTQSSQFTVKRGADGNGYISIRGTNGSTATDPTEEAHIFMQPTGMRVSPMKGGIDFAPTNGTMRLTGVNVPAFFAAGEGMEFAYDDDDASYGGNGLGTILAYDRGGSAFSSMRIRGTTVNLGSTASSTEVVVTNGAALVSGTLYFGSFAGPSIRSGTGSPEGVVTAVIGSMFMRTDGGSGTSLYVKQSGTGNTGWVGK